MDKKELMLISGLMDELIDSMEYSEDDLSERLGRKKPEVEVVKLEGKLPMEGAEESLGEALEMDHGGMDEEQEGYDTDEDDDFEEEDLLEGDMPGESPEDELKRRLMKLRG